jgi:hypothetical protein
LTACCDVGGAEIGDGGDAGVSRDYCRLADLKRGGSGAALISDRGPLVKDCLAVGPDQGDFFWADAEFFGGSQGGLGEDLAEAEIQLA